MRDLLAAGMDLTPLEPTPDVESLEGQDPQAHAEGVLKRRIAALIDKVSSVVFSYVAQVLSSVCLLSDSGMRREALHRLAILMCGNFSVLP